MASPENQRAATDPNNDLDLALNLDLDLDRDLDSPKASASSETALETVVPGRAEPAAPSSHHGHHLKLLTLRSTCKGGRHQIQDLHSTVYEV
jgi:hypothetical protein